MYGLVREYFCDDNDARKVQALRHKTDCQHQIKIGGAFFLVV